MAAIQITAQEASRIVSHMNKEHPESLSHYLEAFGGISASRASVNPTITSFTGPSMDISYGSSSRRKQFTYKFDPPMLAGQARKRLEEMHEEARAKLGLSEITINTFSPDFKTTIQLVWMTLLLVFLGFAPSALLASWLPPADKVVAFFLRQLDVAVTQERIGLTIKVVFIGTLTFLHLLEVVLVLRPLMRKYNMTSTFSRLAYILATISVGFPMWSFLKKTGGQLEHDAAQKAAQGKSH